MLSEHTIDHLVQPIVTRQENINTRIISSIARSVGEIGEISPSEINRMKLLVQYGADIRQMNAEIAKLSGLQVRDIKNVIRTTAIKTHLDAKPLYDYRHKSFIPYDRNTKLQQLVSIIGERTAGTYQNISNSRATGFLIRDLQNPSRLKFQPINDTYQSVIDEAIQSVVTGGVDYRTAMRRTLRQLADSGVRRLSWDSGYTQRLDTAVRRNILDGIRAIQQGVEDALGEEIGATGKELSVHINCALDHEPFQGHQFTNEEWEKLQNSEDFQDVDGKTFAGVERVIGMWNCRHVARSIIVGVTEPLYTKDELQQFIDDNHNGYVLPNGKRITLYECTQIQRRMETNIRYAKDSYIVFHQSGDTMAANLATQKVARLTQEYYKFSRSCGLPVHKDRMAVSGYKI